MIIGTGLWTSPAQAQQPGAEPSQAEYYWPQPSPAVWKVGWMIWPFGGLPINFFLVLGLGLGNASCGEHWHSTVSSLCLGRPHGTSYGEHLLSCLCLGNSSCHCWAAGTLPPCFCLSGQAELIWGNEHLLCVKHLLYLTLLLLVLLLLLWVPYSLLLFTFRKFLCQSVVSAFVPLTREGWRGRECLTWGLLPSWV